MRPPIAARLPLVALPAAAPLLAMTSAWAAPPTAPRTAPAPAAVRAPGGSTTQPTPHTLYISLSRDIVTMPSTLRAGTYYVQVRTTDSSSGVTVVRPPSTLTPSTFYARFQSFESAYSTGNSPVGALHRYRTSATFVGGASTTRGQVGAFAIRLSPGRYWFFAAEGSDPRPLSWKNGVRQLNPSHVRVVTVLGPVPAPVAVPIVGVARFGLDWTAQRSVRLPAALPQRGFVLAVGGSSMAGGMWARRLIDGVSDVELHDGTCIDDVLVQRNCFVGPMVTIGGAVSPGESAWMYYRLPPGDYAVGSSDHSDVFDVFFTAGLVQRVTVS